jgi:hypothetical protein
MFAPNQPRAASELMRVVRPGGRIALANWTPEGFIGRLFRVMSAFVPPPAGVTSPMAWGSEPRLVELFGPAATDIHTTRKHYVFRYLSARHFVDYFRTYYGPTHKAFAALDASRQQELHTALVDLLEAENTNPGTALVVPSEYVEVVITR